MNFEYFSIKNLSIENYKQLFYYLVGCQAYCNHIYIQKDSYLFSKKILTLLTFIYLHCNLHHKKLELIPSWTAITYPGKCRGW